MKVLVILCCAIFAGAHSIPAIQNHPRWNLIPDSSGRQQVADFDFPQVIPEPFFNPNQDVHFLLFTRRNPTTPQRLTFDMNTVRNSNWNSANGVRFIIHGFNSDSNAQLNTLCRDNFLANQDHNVIVVDWSAGSNTFLYATARNRVGVAGGTISMFIDDLHRAGLVDLSKVTIVGHNLGAHVAGNTGKQVTRGRVGAIYGLDANAALFELSDTDRLAYTDAVYTENLHTNTANTGFLEPITRAAFYPNWGASQPGCGVDLLGSCAHERAILYFAESILANRFRARQCSGFQQIATRNCPGIGEGFMGGDVPKTISGVFFLGVNSIPPFAQN